jgi:uncharacterized protein (TIGR00297 family)
LHSFNNVATIIKFIDFTVFTLHAMTIDYIIIITVLVAGMIASVKTGKLTVTASITGGVIGFLIFMGTGFCGVIMMATFFLLGTLATSWKLSVKRSLDLAETDKGRRTAWQVIANAGVAGLLALIITLRPQYTNVGIVMIAASFASATADTLSSELGNVYGRKFYNIITFKKDKRGENGVVSLEGTLIGITGSIIIAVIYALGNKWDINVVWIIIAGTVGNLTDSILGATLERKFILNNNAVNFSNTAIAAAVAFMFYWLTGSR